MFEFKAEYVEYIAIFGIVFLLSAQLAGMGLEANVSESYVSFYSHLALQGLGAVVAMVAYGLWYLSNDPLGLNKFTKAIITIGWTAFIVIMTVGGLQIIGVPKAVESLQVGPTEQLYSATVIPAVLEDINYLVAFPMIIILAMSLVYGRFFGEVGASEYIVFLVIACLISSIGYNIWVIPGFTSAHVPAYGQIQSGYMGAFMFSFGQSMVYAVTGWFIPAAHFLHNFAIASTNIYAVVPPA